MRRCAAGPGAPQLADDRLAVHPPRRRGCDPERSPPLRQRAVLPPPEEYTLPFFDSPDHTRLRGQVNAAFTPRATRALESRIRSVLASLLDAVEDTGGFDFIATAAQPLPVIVVAELLGAPHTDRARFKTWSAQRARLLKPTASRRERAVAQAASRGFDAFFRSIIAAQCLLSPGPRKRCLTN